MKIFKLDPDCLMYHYVISLYIRIMVYHKDIMFHLATHWYTSV